MASNVQDNKSRKSNINIVLAASGWGLTSTVHALD